MPRSKRKTSEVQPEYYCRKCTRDRVARFFYTATNSLLDTNGYMSVCKDCINDMYDSFMQTELSVEATILRLCRLLDVKYEEEAVGSTKLQLSTYEAKGKPMSNIFGVYKSKLAATKHLGQTKEDAPKFLDLTFSEPDIEIKEKIHREAYKDMAYLEKIWGASTGLNKDDYEFLEEEYGKWAGVIGNVTHAEEVLIRDICHLQNQIRRARIEGNFKLVDSLVESRQKIMKDGALTPALQSAAANGKNADCFGNWIRDIETMRPAEWFEDQKKFADMDGMNEDMADIKRSIKNFMTGSRDFNVAEMEGLAGILDMED
jgi:hypothetical protein